MFVCKRGEELGPLWLRLAIFTLGHGSDPGFALGLILCFQAQEASG